MNVSLDLILFAANVGFMKLEEHLLHSREPEGAETIERPQSSLPATLRAKRDFDPDPLLRLAQDLLRSRLEILLVDDLVLNAPGGQWMRLFVRHTPLQRRTAIDRVPASYGP